MNEPTSFEVTTSQGKQNIDIDTFNAVLAMSDSVGLSDKDGEVRDSRTGRIVKGGDGADDALNVIFALEPVFNKLESYLAGTNKYTDMAFITIMIPNDKLTTIHRPVTEHDKWRFPNEWEAFEKGLGETVTGTPLALWTGLSPSQAKELSNNGIRTVEQLAGLSESGAGALRGFYGLKAKAQTFLDASKDAAAAARLQADFDRVKQESAAEVSALKEQMAQMMVLMQAQQAAQQPVADKPSKAK